MNAVIERTYRIEHVSNSEELAELCEAWLDLEAETPGHPIFCNWEWVMTWWRNRDVDSDLWVLAAWDAEGKLAGLAPWMLVRDHVGPLLLRRLTFVGTGIVYPVHLDVVVRPGEEDAVCRAFLTYVQSRRVRWDVLDLRDLRPGSRLKQSLDRLRVRYWELERAAARLSHLPATFETYEREMMTGSRRGHMRQRRRKLERDYPGQVSFERVADCEGLDAAMEGLAELNQERWHDRSVASAFDCEPFVRFHRQMAAIALERGWLRLYVLRVAGDIIAAVYGFLYQGTFYVYQTAFDTRWGRYSPGYLLFTHILQEAIAEGAQEWNMLRGDQEYKLSWSHDVRYDEHLVVGASALGKLWAFSGSVYDRGKVMAREYLPASAQTWILQHVSGKVQEAGKSDGQDVSD